MQLENLYTLLDFLVSVSRPNVPSLILNIQTPLFYPQVSGQHHQYQLFVKQAVHADVNISLSILPASILLQDPE